MAFWKPQNTGDQLAARIDALRDDLSAYRGMIEQLLAEIKSQDDIISELQSRLEVLEKNAEHGSLKTNEEKPETEGMPATNGYTPWSQRKAERQKSKADPQFARRVVRGAQRQPPPPEQK